MIASSSAASLRDYLAKGHVIPALPLALHRDGSWDERYQRALVRYYREAGAGGLAVGVHSTQFAIRDAAHGLFRPVLELAAATAAEGNKRGKFCLIAGVCGRTPQAVREARLASNLGYDAGLLSLGAWTRDSEQSILKHCRRVAREIPLVGFYLQPAVGGRILSHDFWCRFVAIPEVVAIKIAPFSRYQTLDVVRAVCTSGREDVALYTGNDDNIIADLLTPFNFGGRTRHIVGGLLGQWGVWTERAVALLKEIKKFRSTSPLSPMWLERNAALTDANAAIFDPQHGFRGCLPGIHEILRRQGLLRSRRCLDPKEVLSRGQLREIDRVILAYPWLQDDDFVARNCSRWLS